MAVFKIVNDHVGESEEYFIDDVRVGSTNHDEDGWAGMESSRELFKKVAQVLGHTVWETDKDYGEE